MKPTVLVATTVLFTLSIVPTLMAQSAANQTSTMPMAAMGTTALDTVSSVPSVDDFSRGSGIDVDLTRARLQEAADAIRVIRALPAVQRHQELDDLHSSRWSPI